MVLSYDYLTQLSEAVVADLLQFRLIPKNGVLADPFQKITQVINKAKSLRLGAQLS